VTVEARVTPTNEGSSLADASPQPSVELTAGAGSHGCLPGDYGFGKNAAATLLARLGAFVCELLGASNCQTVKGFLLQMMVNISMKFGA